jgi:CubicO group peptidase (beta-lactamase class C family)
MRIVAGLVGCVVAAALAVLPDAVGVRAADAPEMARTVDAPLRAKLVAIVARGAAPDGTAPGVSVAVVERGEIVFTGAAGLADVAAGRKATTQTRFRVGSITKMFTAVSIMQLVERGALHLDDRLARYVPDAPHAGEITIRQLLMHTSGLPNYGDAAFDDGAVKTPTTPAAILASMAARPLDFTPGSKYAYSNTGYVALGQVIERVTKMPLADYERIHIFTPAGMHDTSAGILPADAGTARGYMDANATAVSPYDASWLYADGDIVSTASDLARFDIALMNGRLVSPATFAAMQAAPVKTDMEGATYGLGTTMFALDDLTLVGHHGGLPGFEADNELIPSEKFAVVILGNAYTFKTSSELGPLLATFFPQTSARVAATANAQLLVAGNGEDPALTERFRAFFVALQGGHVDRAAVTAQMNAALGAEQLSEVAQQLGALGTLQKLVFKSKDVHTEGTAYHYVGQFSTQTTPLTFTLDAAGKIAGVFLQ